MRVKLEWLNELVDINDLSVEEIVRRLSLYSIEVESVEKVVSGTNLVVGHVLSREPHPDSDHLSVCNVDVKNEILQIVCGAPNVAKDQYVIVALNGAQLPNGIKIKKSKIRGIESNGMICSLNEIGMEKKFITEDYQSGIYYFKEPVEIGVDALKALNLHDSVIELGLTPNRSDLLSMLGVGIEVSAILNRPLKKLVYDLIRTKEKSSQYINVINQSEDCITYYAQVVKNIQIKPSPRWLISRLIAFGVRPINNVVDITNYILALFGQPLHAFDYDKLGSKIIVRKANDNEAIVTLDNEERKLLKSDLLITDGIKPVAIAGVMGGLGTQITEQSKTIVIEAAVFDPKTIRQTSQRLGLRSDSSIRFEKGVDVNRTKLALDYTCYLLQKYADAQILVDDVLVGKSKIESTQIKISNSDVNNLLGINISNEDIISIIKRLGFEIDKDLNVMVPNRRSDIKIKVDLIEEIGRIYGYDKLPLTIPASSLSGSLTSVQKIRRNIKSSLIGMGLNEVISYSLVSDKENDVFTYNQEENSKQIELLMPLSSDRKYLRMSLIKSLIENAKYCYSRKIKDLAIFEVGKVYYHKDNYQEEEFLSILMSNQFTNTLWQGKFEKVDFYLIKGVLENLFNILKLDVKFTPLDKNIDQLHPKRSASIYLNNENIGFVGCIHPKYAKSNDLDEIYVAEIKLKSILNMQSHNLKYKEISKVPSMERDIAIVINRDILASEIIETIKNVDQKILSDVRIFDVYTGEKVNKDQKSIAINLIFTSYETLTDDLINNKINRILKELSTKYNATLRS